MSPPPPPAPPSAAVAQKFTDEISSLRRALQDVSDENEALKFVAERQKDKIQQGKADRDVMAAEIEVRRTHDNVVLSLVIIL